MSLKAFHLIFIIAAILLAFGFAAWSMMNYFSATGRRMDMVWGVASAIVGVGLIVYEIYFLKKLKNVSYL
jgi:ABC-type amino acid transport system permease subunit